MNTITLLQNKRILLGVSGSIAAYKAIDLASKLTQAGALVDVIMTQAAQQFVTPLAFQAVTGRDVYTDMWQTGSGSALPTHIAHVGLGEGADLLVIAPATANTLAKLAHGLADDLLSVTALAARCPLVIAPAMDGGMYTHPATQANLTLLVQRGAVLIEPDEGRFASGLTGKGRLPETAALIGHIRQALGQDGILAGQKVVVTAGGTREPLDPVRYLTNHSSGKQGTAIAQAALDAGASVTLITSASLPATIGAQIVQVEAAQDMLEAVLEHSAGASALIMAAAVADYRPATRAKQKIKKGDDDLSLSLTRNPDILLNVKDMAQRPKVVVGFAAESENLLANAQSKLMRKGLDMLVANDISATDAGFGSDNNRVVILSKDGTQRPIELTSKEQIAQTLIELVASQLG
ncbi:bifunctional phosphopantothenoylcysteine decarboxylase/phosphopantothenate--cysteine ligase CoaBC [Phototrophicus methaneseepsis]|uniref:Coenzyme A biosynthesis bifunctional protein CoaBC n=1 Tax=Phototrophicus methaneseepsis TaxID=2710758 RepID=A0A7S8IFS4_9CHLR|nr:bifunctional phosphopantothenoylcysteine decarboxylase/phosphopantothenate--cysteine ligase CoaBC [Phototrophicus methaneseepsis]QPC83248.1 bifunctional phosphopantothenoylcysteine decarboxylase/phosphopantothenate--cysteine ligase CoaBC [Phototrophicus methaneseepsis]